MYLFLCTALTWIITLIFAGKTDRYVVTKLLKLSDEFFISHDAELFYYFPTFFAGKIVRYVVTKLVKLSDEFFISHEAEL